MLGCYFLSIYTTAQVADFSFQNISTQTCLPTTYQFTASSSVHPVGYLWDFGNGNKSNSANPTTTYYSAGNFRVSLIVVYENSTTKIIKNIIVTPSITASFLTDKDTLCAPGLVHFSANQMSGVLNYEWDFGDSTNNITTTFPSTDHYFSKYGIFDVMLQVTGANGCTTYSHQWIHVIKPEISGNVSSKNGCIPAIINFNTFVKSHSNNATLNYEWDFGDGSLADIASNQISHQYINTGVFVPQLMITTGMGCTSTFIFDSLKFGIPPNGIKSYTSDTIFCGSEKPFFIAKATLANEYKWSFAGTIITTKDTIVGHKFNSLGKKLITVSPVFNGCKGLPDSFYVQVIGVIAKYKYFNTCADKKTFTLSNLSLGNISHFLWSFGDGELSNQITRVQHTYPVPGLFNATLIIDDTSTHCIDSFSNTIETAVPYLYNTDQSICINTFSKFRILNNYNNTNSNHYWYVLGNLIPNKRDSSISVLADSTGIFPNKVIIKRGVAYCQDTLLLNHLIKVRGPEITFSMPENICLQDSMYIINGSHPFQNTDTIKIWQWDFGVINNQQNIYQPNAFLYSIPKNYIIKLKAIDKNGCQDSLVKKVNVHPMPFLWIIPRKDTLCQRQTIQIIGYTSDSIYWKPVPNTIFCLHCDTINFTPAKTSNLFATSINSFNCMVNDSIHLQVIMQFDAELINKDTALCANNKLQLEVTPTNKIIQWTPITHLNNSKIYNPIATVNKSISYIVLLSDSSGCFSSEDSVNIKIKTSPQVNAGNNQTIAYHSTFTLCPTFSSNVIKWLWAPATGLDCDTCLFPMGILEKTSTYYLTAISDSGCIAKDQVTIHLLCNEANIFLPGAFTPNGDNLNDLYRPIARGDQTVIRFAIYNKFGQLVYEKRNSNDQTLGWDGKFQGKDQEATAYVYRIEATCENGDKIIKTGSFLLLR